MVEKIMGIQDVREMCSISGRVIYAALKSGELAGRNIGGRKGWITTRTAVLDWVESGNAVEDDDDAVTEKNKN